MSSSKSKKRSSSEVKKSVDMDTNTSSEHHLNDPIESEEIILNKCEKARVKGNKLLEIILKRESVGSNS